MLTLGIDTSNYATSLALVDNTSREVVCSKKEMLPVKPGELGLRQSDAVFQHTLALPALSEKLFADCGVSPARVEAVGVSEKPRPVEGSYMPCFLAGISFATAFSLAREVPLHRTTHQQGHLDAARLYARNQCGFSEQRHLFFHVSGGTTELLLCEGSQVVCTVGKSLDLYAGQAVDRLGVKLGYAFPSGAYVSSLAAEWAADVRPKSMAKGADCHLSGLQNQYERMLDNGAPPPQVAKYCLLCIAATAADMIEAARRTYPGMAVLCAGGVMASGIISAYLTAVLTGIYFVPSLYSSDNAIGVAALAAGTHHDKGER